MPKYLAAYAAVIVSLIALDAVWLGLVAQPAYTAGIGHLMADQPNLGAALAFYVVYALGLVVFAIAPARDQAGLRRSALVAAAFGFFAYATYDLTNLATLRDWPLGLSLLDLLWGCVISAISAAAGKTALDRIASR